ERPPYQGANPISDLWCEKAIKLVREFLPKAVKDGQDRDARTQMMLATIYAGMGFANAGVHIPHAMGYPIAGNVRGFYPPDYPHEKPLVPHGMSTSLGAPASFHFTAKAKPERHKEVAEWMGVKTRGSGADSAGGALHEAFIAFIQRLSAAPALVEFRLREPHAEGVRGFLAPLQGTGLVGAIVSQGYAKGAYPWLICWHRSAVQNPHYLNKQSSFATETNYLNCT